MHLHYEIPLSSVHLTAAEEAGEIGTAYGLASAAYSHRLPSNFPSPICRFLAPRPSARRAAPPRQPHGNGPATSAA